MNATHTIVAGLRWRYATKKFDATRTIQPELLAQLEESLLLAPSSFGLQPWKFIWVETPALRRRLRAAAWDQSQVTDASHFLVLCRRSDLSAADVDRWVARIAEVRGVSVDSLAGFRQMMIGSVENPDRLPGGGVATYVSRQVYIALGVLLTAAAALGVDACPMEGFDPVQFDEILGLKGNGWHATVCCALGYRAADDGYAAQAKVRFDRARVIARV